MATTNKGLETVCMGMLRADIPLAAAIADLDNCIPELIHRQSGVNAKAAGAVTAYTVPTGKRLVLTSVVVRATAADAVTGAVSLSVGANASTYDDFLANTSMLLDAVGEYYLAVPSGVKSSYAAGTNVKYNVRTPAVGTTLTVVVELYGYLTT